MKEQKQTDKRQYQICVSGAARGSTVENNKDVTYQLGQAITNANHTLMTGATSGLPYFAARGAQDGVGGRSVGLSPAQNEYAHTHFYDLPTDCYDIIFYTGQDFVGRDVLLIQSSDAIISVGGRIGTLHEFAVAMELGKPVGVLTGTGGTSDLFDDLLRVAGSEYYPDVIYDDDPEKLVAKMEQLLQDKRKEYEQRYRERAIREQRVP